MTELLEDDTGDVIGRVYGNGVYQQLRKAGNRSTPNDFSNCGCHTDSVLPAAEAHVSKQRSHGCVGRRGVLSCVPAGDRLEYGLLIVGCKVILLQQLAQPSSLSQQSTPGHEPQSLKKK